MFNALLAIFVKLIGVVVAHPALLLPVLVLFGIGGLIPSRKMTPAGLRSSMGWAASPVIAVLAIFGFTTWLYKNRRDAGRVLIGFVVAAAALTWVLLIQFSPRGWTPVLVIGGCLGGLAGLMKMHKVVGDQKLDDWFATRVLGQQVAHAAGHVLEGVNVYEATARPDGTIEAHAQLPAGATLDQFTPEKVGSALAHQGMPIAVRQVDVKPGDTAGQFTLLVSPEPPKPVWETIAAINNSISVADWSKTISDDPADSLPLGPSVDLHTGAVGVVYVPAFFPHVLIAGATGAGKSGGFIPMIGGRAHKRHNQLVLLDPQGVEFSPWEPRALFVARGVRETYDGLQWVLKRMHEREQIMMERGIRKWRVGKDGVHIDVFLDELAAATSPRTIIDPPLDAKGLPMSASKVSDLNADAVGQIVSKARKLGIRLWSATQRSDAKYFEDGSVRDNYGFRVAYAHDSGRGAHMVLGEGGDIPDPTEISNGLKGGCYVRTDRRVYVAARPTFIVPRQHVDDPDEMITVAAEEIAAATAHLRDERLTYDLED